MKLIHSSPIASPLKHSVLRLVLGITIVLPCGSVAAGGLSDLIKDAKEAANRIAEDIQNKKAETAPKDGTQQTDAEPEAADKTPSPPVTGNSSSSKYDKQMVRDIQRMLNEIGYSAGPSDGYYRLGTQKALKEFQRDRGLAVTGQPTYAAVKALDAAAQEGFRKPAKTAHSDGQTQQQGATATSGTSVSTAPWKPCNHYPKHDDEEICYQKPLVMLFSSLERLGYRTPHISWNKGPTSEHRAVIMKFQGDYGLTVDGRPTTRVYKAANKAYKEQRAAKFAAEEAARQEAKANEWSAPTSEHDRDHRCRRAQNIHRIHGELKPEAKAFAKTHCRDKSWAKALQ